MNLQNKTICGGAVEMLAGQFKIDFLTTTKILIVELSSQSLQKKTLNTSLQNTW